MNTVAEKPVTALTLPERAAVALGTAHHEIKLRELVQASCRIVAVTNKAGRDECHTAYMVLKNTRCSITNLSDDATEDAKAFTKAVKAEAVRLLKITEAEESRLQTLRDEWDTKIEAEKQAKIAAEVDRVRKIREAIDTIKAAPVRHVESDSVDIARAIEFYMIMPVTAAAFEEFADEAKGAVAATIEKLKEMEVMQAAQEELAREAEADRVEELARLKAEKEELAELRAAAAKVAAEQVAEAKRLADLAAAQEAEAKRQRDQAAAEHAELGRVAAEREAKANAELKAAQDKLNAEQAEFRAQQAAAQAAAILAQEIEISHGLERIENAERDAAELENVMHAQLKAAHTEALADDLARCAATAAALLKDGRQGIDAAYEQETIHCWKFHELAMDYRSASVTMAQGAYEQLVAYIDNYKSGAE